MHECRRHPILHNLRRPVLRIPGQRPSPARHQVTIGIIAVGGRGRLGVGPASGGATRTRHPMRPDATRPTGRVGIGAHITVTQ